MRDPTSQRAGELARLLTSVTFPDSELGLWAGLGHVSDRSVRVWLRDPECRSHVARAFAGERQVAEARLEPAADRDGVAAADLTLDRPRPGTPVVVEVAGMRRQAVLAPYAGEPANFTFAFGSCSEPFAVAPGPALRRSVRAGIYAPMRRTLSEQQARFLLLIGDQLYTDRLPALNIARSARGNPALTDDALLELFRLAYRGFFNERGFRELLGTLPVCSIWDDHDIFEGWGSHLVRSELDRRLFAAAGRAYVEYQHMRNPGARWDAQPSHHYHFWYGDVGFFVLDVRGLRDFRTGRVIGEQQWAALEAFFAEADARRVRTAFVVASEPLVHFPPALMSLMERIPRPKKSDVRDRLTNERFRPERDALLQRLFAWQADAPGRQLVLLSGDVHCGTVTELRARKGHGRIMQWTSSALSTRPPVGHHVMNAVGGAWPGIGDDCCVAARQGLERRNNFGIVEVRSTGDGGHDIALTLHAYDLGRRRLVRSLQSQERPSR